ncbi:peptidylprolyl isomerase [Flavobacteriales bacterium]|nr:peptidylprolyl isomerase [Flavobacteriales bacterium]
MKAITVYSKSLVAIAMTLFCVQGLAQVKDQSAPLVKNISPKKVTPKGKEILFEIRTSFGTMKGKLYNTTPIHRDNFVKLVQENYYDSLLFHRVINQFMIQGGDPGSRNAAADKPLGNGGPGYTLKAEILPALFHKKGVLSAARQPDNVNPEKRSSGSQFYLVQGKVYSEQMLKTQEQRVNQSNSNKIIRDYLRNPENKADLDAVSYCQKNKLDDSLSNIIARISAVVSKNQTPFTFTPDQRNAYSTVGGTPHLDNGYTVFGEIIEGLSVIDKIAAIPVGPKSRPKENVIMTIRILDQNTKQ